MIFIFIFIIGVFISSGKAFALQKAFKFVEKACKMLDKITEDGVEAVVVSVDSDEVEKRVKVKRTVNEKQYWGCVAFEEGNPVVGCFVVNEIGKELPITFGVCVEGKEEKPKIKLVEVLKYREPRGGEIRSRIFLKQFRGKSLDDPIRVSKDIKNIRGATLSAYATARAVKIALALFLSVKDGNFRKESVTRKIPESKLPFSKSFQVGELFLTITCFDERCIDVLPKVQEFVRKANFDLWAWWKYAKVQGFVRETVEKWKGARTKTNGYFDIFWSGKPDVGAVWKGTVVDKIVSILKSNKAEKFLIDFSSTFYFSGCWYVDVLGDTFQLCDVAVSLSEGEGEYSEVFNPVSGKFVKRRMGVAVFSESAEYSDFASTLCVITQDCMRYFESDKIHGVIFFTLK